MNYFIGEMPEFEGYNLFSEKPIVAILETEGRSQDLKDGSKVKTGGDYKVVGFDTISEAWAFRKKHEDPDKAPTTVKIYAFGSGEWKIVNYMADSN